MVRIAGGIMNVTDRQLPPSHRWNCCFGCKCKKILDGREQKVAEEVDQVARPVILLPPPLIRRSLARDFDLKQRTIPIDIPLPNLICPRAPQIRPISPRPESPSPIERRYSEAERVSESKEWE